MTPHRDDREALRAENDRLRAEVASLRAKPAKVPAVPMRWAAPVPESDVAKTFGGMLLHGGFWGGMVSALGFVFFGAEPGVLRGAGVCASLLLLWCLTFVRRVPR